MNDHLLCGDGQTYTVGSTRALDSEVRQVAVGLVKGDGQDDHAVAKLGLSAHR